MLIEFPAAEKLVSSENSSVNNDLRTVTQNYNRVLLLLLCCNAERINQLRTPRNSVHPMQMVQKYCGRRSARTFSTSGYANRWPLTQRCLGKVEPIYVRTLLRCGWWKLVIGAVSQDETSSGLGFSRVLRTEIPSSSSLKALRVRKCCSLRIKWTRVG